ncbi:hypothetical protein N7447_003349 [Penicillium robsamsonii]|uniref:uncharacterized protein n=1 Tax=Penicillium robsamsonii TaxID=1792511 RepID=UPI002548A050|nr:uncharacterized protein N7447_003349 [Penicillium robsamsonii]KAJ5826586.1 hypothetical protein N7447_003349 [Penicillium robsamsonii]
MTSSSSSTFEVNERGPPGTGGKNDQVRIDTGAIIQLDARTTYWSGTRSGRFSVESLSHPAVWFDLITISILTAYLTHASAFTQPHLSFIYPMSPLTPVETIDSRIACRSGNSFRLSTSNE